MARNYLSGWVGGRVGGWIFWKYSHLSPQLKLGLGLGLSLAIRTFLNIKVYLRNFPVENTRLSH